MLRILEKTVWGLSVLAIFGCAAVWLIAGDPGTTPRIVMQSRIQDEKEFLRDRTQAEIQQIREIQIKSEALKLPGSGRAKPAKAKQEWRTVNRAVYDRVSNYNRARHEMDKAKSEIIKDKDGNQIGLKIFGFNNSSALNKLGFEENDIIQAIDGEVIDFSSMSDCLSAYNKRKPLLEAGTPLIILVERNGVPVQVTFRMEE